MYHLILMTSNQLLGSIRSYDLFKISELVMKDKLDFLWEEISSIPAIPDRIKVIFQDVSKDLNRYKSLAEEDPYRLFELLGGDEANATRANWAFEYQYEDYLEENGEEFDSEIAAAWNVEEKSIERAVNSGHWYVTGIVVLYTDDLDEVVFELQFTEGYFDGIIGTPYHESEIHGFLFD